MNTHNSRCISLPQSTHKFTAFKGLLGKDYEVINKELRRTPMAAESPLWAVVVLNEKTTYVPL